MARVEGRSVERLLGEVEAAIAFDQPELVATVRGNAVETEGHYHLVPTAAEHSATGSLAQYHVRIVLNEAFPEIEPRVYELAKAFPHQGDFHVNHNGTCCIHIFEIWLATATDISVEGYLNGPFRNFFLSQYIKATTGQWPFGEERHAVEGLLDAYAELLGCKPEPKVVARFLRVISTKWIRGRWDCPCGSGKKIRSCCAASIGIARSRIDRRRIPHLQQRLRRYTKQP